MPSEAGRTIGLDEKYANDWDKDWTRLLFEKSWVDRFLVLLPPQASILDLGCCSAAPIARYLIDKGFGLTGVDTSPLLDHKLCLLRR